MRTVDNQRAGREPICARAKPATPSAAAGSHGSRMQIMNRAGRVLILLWAVPNPAKAVDLHELTTTQIVGLAAILGVTAFAWHAVVLLFSATVRILWGGHEAPDAPPRGIPLRRARPRP
jgi:hypothetical protein